MRPGRIATNVRPVLLLTAVALAAAVAAEARVDGPRRRSWDFEKDAPGTIARGFRNEAGRWEVAVDDAGNHVLSQRAESPDAAFNVALADDTSYRDVDLSVRLRAVAGTHDQGGGLVWRARDPKNYYVARYNPLENNYRVYKVEAGKRTQFESATVAGDRAWHTLRVTMKGTRIVCYFDGAKTLVTDDTTFPDAGRIGLWSKADARSDFDDLNVAD